MVFFVRLLCLLKYQHDKVKLGTLVLTHPVFTAGLLSLMTMIDSKLQSTLPFDFHPTSPCDMEFSSHLDADSVDCPVKILQIFIYWGVLD